jgi:hypothetical protein
MQGFMTQVAALEAEMEASGSFVFGGALHGPDAATVMRLGDGGPLLTDGPFAESKEHIAGFYIINADDLDAALAWSRRQPTIQSRSAHFEPPGASRHDPNDRPAAD